MKMSEDISGLHLVEGTPICEDETGRVVAAFYSESEAAEVVHKVNCHDELVEALELCIGVIDLYGVKFGLDLSGDPSEGRKKVGAILAKAKG